MAISFQAMHIPTQIYEFVMAHLRAKTIPQRQVARESGVPFSTLSKIAQGSVKDPGVHTVQRLANYFASQPNGPKASAMPVVSGHSDQKSAA